MTALPLDSSRWSELRDFRNAPASYVPALIRSIAGDLANADWHDIYTRLCHQGTTYSASYAFVPHLIDIAERVAPGARLELLGFVGEVAGAHETAMPPDLEAAYRDALRRADPLIVETGARVVASRWPVYMRIALAKVRGDLELASELEDELDEEE